MALIVLNYKLQKLRGVVCDQQKDVLENDVKKFKSLCVTYVTDWYFTLPVSLVVKNSDI